MINQQKKRGRPRKNNSWSTALLQERAREYFDKCEARTKTIGGKDGPVEISDPIPYSIEGLCVYLDIPRWKFDAWRKQDDDLGHRAQMIHQKITANRVEGALDGRQNSAFARFMLTNNDAEHYREHVEVKNTVGDEVKSILDKLVGSWKNDRLKG